MSNFDPHFFLEEYRRRTAPPEPPLTGRWTAQARQRQAELIHEWKPWESSTGPTSIEGKAIASENSRIHGLRDRTVRSAMRDLANFRRDQR